MKEEDSKGYMIITLTQHNFHLFWLSQPKLSMSPDILVQKVLLLICQVFYTTNASLFQQPGNLVETAQMFNLTNDQVIN